MTEDRKPRPHFNNGLGGFPPSYKRIEIYPEEEMTVETVHDLTDTHVAHLQDFKEFLKKNILNEGQIVMISLQAVNDTVKEEFGRDECMGSISMRHIIRKCEEYITHIDALLLGK